MRDDGGAMFGMALSTSRKHFRAPADSGAFLLEPEWPTDPKRLWQNRSRLPTTDRSEFLELARLYHRTHNLPEPGFGVGPWVVTGHQPELCHPGVWAKNFATNGLAHHFVGVGLLLIADSDLVKTPSLTLPSASGSLQRYNCAANSGSTYEKTPIDRAAFLKCGEALRNWQPPFPTMVHYWPTQVEAHANLGEVFSAMRRRAEAKMGCVNWELPVSWLVRTSLFADFVGRIEADLPRFQRVYNAAIQNYRKLYRVRSANHPAPLLQDGERPFWRMNGNHRERPFASHRVSELRPRALTLMLFVRRYVADFFFHGIGGGMYDQVTDEIFQQFYDITPPHYGVVTLTARLPYPGVSRRTSELREIVRVARDRHWNPERYLGEFPAELQTLIDSAPTTRAGRRERYAAIRHFKAKLRDQLPASDDTARYFELTREDKAALVLFRRDYPWILHPFGKLHSILLSLLFPTSHTTTPTTTM
ncbi:MAG: hypothetical protein ACRC8S_16045 [Fimbriiglobus sp.]